jgi:transposase-like protein
MAEDGQEVGAGAVDGPPNPEVVPRATRRQYTAEYKLQILEELETHKDDAGYVGRVLRREGLYSSMLSTWREQRREASLKALGKTRGREGESALEAEIERLRAELARATRRLEQVEVVLTVQKKCLLLLGLEEQPQGGGS